MAIMASGRPAKQTTARAAGGPASGSASAAASRAASGAASGAGGWGRATHPDDEAPTTPLATMGGFPHEVTLRVLSAPRGAGLRQVDVEADVDAVLDDWRERGRVELMVRGRPLVLETDLDGRGIRLVEPMGREPVAAFEPGRHGGRVHLADGAVLRWLAPGRHEFASGFVGHQDANIIRFALDGTALVLVDLDEFGSGAPRPGRAAGAGSRHTHRGDVADPRLGWLPDVVALLVLGWFLRLAGSGPAAVDRWAEPAGLDVPAGLAGLAGLAGSGGSGRPGGWRGGLRPMARRLPAAAAGRSDVR